MTSRFALLLPLLAVLPACSNCVLADSMAEVAGGDAIDCGSLELNDDPAGTLQCMVDAFRAGHAFVFEQQVQGSDSLVKYGTAGARDGRVCFFGWDSDPSGGSGEPSRTSRMECLQPFIRVIDASEENSSGLPPGTETIDCEDTSPHQYVCGGEHYGGA